MQRMGVVFAHVTHPCQPSPVPRPDRPAHRPFRGLLSVHSRCGLHTRTVTVCCDRYPKASDTSSPPCLLRSLPAGAVAGRGLHPLEKCRLVTAHVASGRSMARAPLDHRASKAGAVPSIKNSGNADRLSRDTSRSPSFPRSVHSRQPGDGNARGAWTPHAQHPARIVQAVRAEIGLHQRELH